MIKLHYFSFFQEILFVQVFLSCFPENISVLLQFRNVLKGKAFNTNGNVAEPVFCSSSSPGYLE